MRTVFFDVVVCFPLYWMLVSVSPYLLCSFYSVWFVVCDGSIQAYLFCLLSVGFCDWVFRLFIFVLLIVDLIFFFGVCLFVLLVVWVGWCFLCVGVVQGRC